MSDRFDPFESPLLPGLLRRRYKRFLADIILDDGQEIVAHCPNSGSMMGLREEGSPVWVRAVDDPRRKLPFTWELVSPDDGRTWVGINTQRPNQVVEWAIRTDHVPGLSPTSGLRREVSYGQRSRIDILLGDDEVGLTYVEVKNTTLARGEVALFPDAVTERGAKHMRELAAVSAAGHGAVVIFFVNRGDSTGFAVADDIDPAYAAAYDNALDAGVEMMPLGMTVSPMGWTVRGPLPTA